MADIPLLGCTPEPLMSYLKALGVFRLVAEDHKHGDPDSNLSWKGGIAQLSSRFDRDGLISFFRDKYQPTPILAPWNGGSGFYEGGAEPLRAIENSTDSRLARYRSAIAYIRPVVPKGKPTDEQKLALLAWCRAELPDEVVPWLDVCYVLGESGVSFFPMLGTGGNDGRLDFTNNFFQRLADVIWFGVPFALPPTNRDAWLEDALFTNTLVSLRDTAIGQFNPGGIGGANGVQGNFESGSRVNPWEFVLMIEGALLFAGSVARRLGANSDRAAFPFTVESIVVGNESFSEKESRTQGKEPPNSGEVWLPIWSRPFSYIEVKHLFAEGRAQLGRRQARNSIEFALSVCMLGTSRGLDSFARYGFLRRNGKAFLATPLGRFKVEPRPRSQLLDDAQFVTWLDKLRDACRESDGKRDKVPLRYKIALRQIGRSMFAFANRSESGNDAKYLANVLAAIGRAERTLAGGLKFCKEKYIRPLQGLLPQWLDQADDGSPEFRLAAALAGVVGSKKGEVGPLRTYLEEVEVTKFVSWSPGSKSAVWSNQSVAANLAAVFRRRQMEAYRGGLKDGIPLRCKMPARLDDVLAFLREETNDAKLSDLLWGLIAVNWAKAEVVKPNPSHDRPPVEFGIPRLVVTARGFDPRPVGDRLVWTLTNDREANAKYEPDAFHALASGSKNPVSDAVTYAARRLNSGGLAITGYRNRQRTGHRLEVTTALRPERLLAAMLFPLSARDLVRVANTVLYPPESEE